VFLLVASFHCVFAGDQPSMCFCWWPTFDVFLLVASLHCLLDTPAYQHMLVTRKTHIKSHYAGLQSDV
jgi:hypothetical protein